MNKVRLTINVLAIAIFTFAFASFAQGQATRTWVSGVGDDVNPCSRTAPCKTFAGAISKTFINGEIDCLDEGGFGAVYKAHQSTVNREVAIKIILPHFSNHPDFIRRLAERFPTVPIILYHTYLGSHEGRRRAAWHVREQPNLYLETSWCDWQTVVELVEAVGAERVLFGSDASVDGPHHYCRHPPNVGGRETYNQGLVSLVRALGARAARQVLGDNARRLFGLDHPS